MNGRDEETNNRRQTQYKQWGKPTMVERGNSAREEGDASIG